MADRDPTNMMMRNFAQKPKQTTASTAYFGTPYQFGETPLGENLTQGEVPKSIRKTFRRHPEIEALSFLPDLDTHTSMQNDIALHGIKVPILLWRTTRETTDGRTITEYVVVDGYVRLTIAEDLKIPMEMIPWMVDESIQSIEDALNTAARLKIHRANYNECERKYMIGLRYLQEKKRAGAPIGSFNNPSGLPKPDSFEDNEDSVDDLEPNAAKFAALGPDQSSLARTSAILSKELNLGERTIYNYARSAQQLEIAVEEIVRRWGVARARAVRCCTQVHLQKFDKNGATLDARLVTAADWSRLDLQPGCLDRFPLTLPKDPRLGQQSREKYHYHDEREEAVITAVRDLVTPPRMRPDFIDAEFSMMTSKLDENDPWVRFHRLQQSSTPDEVLMKTNPEFAEMHAQYTEMVLQDLINRAATHPDKEMRLSALRELAYDGHPLPTDELDAAEVEKIRRVALPGKEKQEPSAYMQELMEKLKLEPEWLEYAEITKKCDKAMRQYRDALKDLEETLRELLNQTNVVDKACDEDRIETLATIRGPQAKHIKEFYLELAKVLYDTTANTPFLVVNRDRSIHDRIKSLAISCYDIFAKNAGADVARQITISTRLVTHKSHSE